MVAYPNQRVVSNSSAQISLDKGRLLTGLFISYTDWYEALPLSVSTVDVSSYRLRIS
jgi:hypothetical protein